MYIATRSEEGGHGNLVEYAYETIYRANLAYFKVFERAGGLVRALYEAQAIRRYALDNTLRNRHRFRNRFLHRFKIALPHHSMVSDIPRLTLIVDALINMTDHCAAIWIGQRDRMTEGDVPDLEAMTSVITDIWYWSLFGSTDGDRATAERLATPSSFTASLAPDLPA